MKLRVDWIVSGEVEIPDDTDLSNMKDIADAIPDLDVVLNKTFDWEVEYVKLSGTVDGEETTIEWDFEPAGIRTYEGTDPEPKGRRTR